MKIKSISILLMLVSVAATAQRGEDEKNVSFGIRAGVNFQNINGKDRYDHTLKNKLVTRFHAGINAEFLLAPDYY
ncbi:MAG TPA: hypothetical protein VL947_10675, partial [Cytophagales bacterium]|nr:hypothetical protein [Cytophagales bacterium]